MRLTDLAQFLNDLLAVTDYSEEQNGIYRPSERPIQRIGLALEPWTGILQWAERECLDAILLHRPWRLDLTHGSGEIGILAYHLSFDEHLTLGDNPYLAKILGMTQIEKLGEKQGRPLGMIGDIVSHDFASWVHSIEDIFGGSEAIIPPTMSDVRRVAVVGAMTDALVREARSRGAQAYLTGQIRQPSRQAVAETGLGVIAVGHKRSEEWGLQILGQLLQKRWPELVICLGN